MSVKYFIDIGTWNIYHLLTFYSRARCVLLLMYIRRFLRTNRFIAIKRCSIFHQLIQMILLLYWTQFSLFTQFTVQTPIFTVHRFFTNEIAKHKILCFNTCGKSQKPFQTLCSLNFHFYLSASWKWRYG